MLTSPTPRPQLDYRQIRAVITPSGAHLWVLPGAHGLFLPLSKPTVTLRIDGRRRTLRPPVGVYAVRTSRGRRPRAGTVVVGPAP